MRFCKCDGQWIFIICQFRYQLYIVFLFMLSPSMLQLIIEYKLVCLRKMELDSSPPSCCSIAVVHSTSLPIKKYCGHSLLCPFVSFTGTHPGYWGVGCGVEVGWRCGKSIKVYLGCECRCLRRMKGLCRRWEWAGLWEIIRLWWDYDTMEWWGIGVQYNGSLMGGEILRRGWGVVMSLWGGGWVLVVMSWWGGHCEWWWYGEWGVLTRVGGGCKPDFVWRS